MKAYLRKDGRYECRIYCQDSMGNRHYRSFYGRTAEEAEEKSDGYRSVLPKITGDSCTVSVLFQEWFDCKQTIHKESTQANYRIKAYRHILPEKSIFGI